ncbi:glycosyltransferase [Pedobacter alluvionis]|uniref:Glycosyl transferase family 2 n=1 Tax=Pedobacter alluvionis TaxID=475253 RepID=A0A497Y1M7_9SPHI|nr:glycosyltransferase [Pedobacter alluvionis]RLJ73900.1 glycosyl transferase family 2 [Pedobacter alluvionis]TFB32493.1 glycosyltransferase [Pedobacter alluvionis]
MDKLIQFSVLLSLYGGEDSNNFIDALESIENQVYKPDQVVLVIDGPIASQLEKVVHSFVNRLNDLTILRLNENVGLGTALNKGLEVCKYEWVARMDTDDICYPERFEKQITYLINHPQIHVLGSAVQEFNVVPNDLGVFRILPSKMDEIKKFSKFRNPLNHPSVIFKKTVIIDVGSYLDMPLFEDFYLWTRIIQKGYIIENLIEPLLHFRIGNDMIGRRHGFSYLKKEIHYLTTVKTNGFINFGEYIVSILTKAPLRLMPKNILKFIYRKFLR